MSSSISLSLTISLITITLLCSVALANAVSFQKIYAFGDSFTDTGNTKSLSGPFQFVSNYPYGSTFFNHSTYRYSDGRLMIDFLTEKLSFPYLPPYLQRRANRSRGVNFAVAGATAIDTKFFLRNNVSLLFIPQSLRTQFIWFEQLLESRGCKNLSATPQQCKAVFDKALIWVGEIGVNDYAYTLRSSIPNKTIRQLTIKSITQFLQALLNRGAKYVVVQGMPPAGCLTLSMSMYNRSDRDDIGCIKRVNELIYIHNDILKCRLTSLRKNFPNAVIAYADYWSAYRFVMKNPSRYGFHERFSACCGSSFGEYNLSVFGLCGSLLSTSCKNPSEYINWDGVHLTEAMYKAVSELLFTRFTYPPLENLLTQ